MNLHSANSHAGDLQWSLIALSRIPGEHTLRCADEYIEPLRGLVDGLPITIDNCAHVPVNSLNCWIASGQWEHLGVHYNDPVDIMGFVARYFNAMAGEMGYEHPFKTREDLLMDFPAIAPNGDIPHAFTGILVINADPKSGQCPNYSSSEMDSLIKNLEAAGNSVCSIESAELTLAQIGRISTTAKLIIGCATGPWWPTMNMHNRCTQRIVMLDPMRLDYGSVPIVHARDAHGVQDILNGMGYL
jgi:hypothetical protein